jgi:hypothetical protein
MRRPLLCVDLLTESVPGIRALLQWDIFCHGESQRSRIVAV